MKILLPTMLVFASALSSLPAHDHFPAGVIDSNGNGQSDQGEPLELVEPHLFNKIFHLLPRAVGRRGGGRYVLDELPRVPHPLDAFSFTVLSPIEDGDPRSPANGAIVGVELVSVTGPNGGTFHFWDDNTNSANAEPTYALAANQPVPANTRFFITEDTSNDPGSDPFGHIHNRLWSADLPGDYVLGFRLVDVSSNAENGQPWHTPSEIYHFRFRAGPRFHPVTTVLAGGQVRLIWPSLNGIFSTLPQYAQGIVFEIQRASRLDSPEWVTIGTVTGTANATVEFTDTDPPDGPFFYRLKYAWKLSSP